MLTIHVKLVEYYDEERSQFVADVFKLDMEHSLISLSKWESKHERPFLDDSEKSPEDILEYIKAMTITPDVPDEVFDSLSTDNLNEINAYISAKKTATWFSEHDKKAKPGAPKETITSELIYYWMLSYNIPMECENWHLNRLFTLIQVFNVKNSKPKKMTASERAARNRELNEKRKAQLGTSG